MEANLQCPAGGILENMLAVRSHKSDEILAAVLDIQTNLELKIDALTIFMDLLREDHRKLKERVKNTETTLAFIIPMVSVTNAHIKAL
ncbi:hypothetical protein NDU88_004561 [Pleurodeles waltl]|uniref:Uncharacterized protein n=1 Tax=Pleurodeles waltl TaxID=8319 RepID=A0AAV7SJ95_PLEWA|nr:hypothetical protein NDU88_004561 [Pleurodeles waltl]